MDTMLLIYVAGAAAGLILLWLGWTWLSRRIWRAMLMKRHDDAQMVDVIMEGRIARGMTAEMVHDVWGEPADIDETVLKTKAKLEMKYNQTGKNRYGTRVHLEDGRVVGWEIK